MDVPARELKNRLGSYLRAVKAGQSIRITTRGKPVAMLVPATSSDEDVLARLAAAGRIRLGKGRLEPVTPKPAERSASELSLEERAAER